MIKQLKNNLLLIAFALTVCMGMSGAEAKSAGSVYNVKLEKFTEDNNKPVELKNFEGKKVVLSMVYTSCEHACPLMMKKLKKIDDQLRSGKVDAEIVVVSFDPKFDQPQKLNAFRKHYEGVDAKWHLLVGTEKSTRMLANVLDIKYKRNPEDQTISHDNKVILLNEKGEIVRTLEGLMYDPKADLF